MASIEKKYLIALFVISLITISIRLLQPKPIDWSEGYSAEEKKPFGTFILANTLDELFPDQTITTNQGPIFELTTPEKSENLIFINSSFEIDEFETEILMDRVSRGSSVFISAWQFSGAFADSLNIQVAYTFPEIGADILSLDSLLQNNVSFTNPNLEAINGWNFPIRLTESYFSSFDTTSSKVLGRIDDSLVNYIEFNYGSGSFFIHTNPFLLTNYYIKDLEKYDYAFRALSYLPVRTTIWDEYYKIGRINNSTPLTFIVSEESLRRAWFIGVFGLIIFLTFGAKRSQRIIPELKSVSNSSIQFASTIAQLYLNNSSHKAILKKKVAFLNDYIRNNLGINVTDYDADTLISISQRSGIELEEIQSIFRLIDVVSIEKDLTNKRLKEVTDRIDWFYKHSLR